MQYNRRNCITFSDIPDTINDNKLKETIIKAYKDVYINASETDIEACHRLPLISNATIVSKRVTVKFVIFILGTLQGPLQQFGRFSFFTTIDLGLKPLLLSQ